MMGLAGMAEDLASQRKAFAQEKQQRISGGSGREAYIHVVGPDTIDHAAGEGGHRQTREVNMSYLSLVYKKPTSLAYSERQACPGKLT